MELDIIKILRRLRQSLRHKPSVQNAMQILEEPKLPKVIKQAKPQKKKHELIKTVVNGRELSLSQIALFYNLKPHTVYARYRVGNRGKLLIRQTPQQKRTSEWVKKVIKKPT